MSLNIQTSTGLLEISTKVTKDKVIEALGYEPANETHVKDNTVHITSEERENWNNKFDGTYSDLEGSPNITENESGNLVIADNDGNAIMQVDENGITTTNVNTKTIALNGEDLGSRLDSLESISLPNILDNETGDLTISDENGNAIMKVDASGITTTGVSAKTLSLNGEDIGTKIDAHLDDSVSHVTSSERTKWNNKSDFSGDFNDLNNKPNITDDGSGELVLNDNNGNVIMKVDADGVTTTNVNTKTINLDGKDLGARIDELEEISLPNILDNETGDLTISDEDGNAIMKVDANGLKTTTVTADSAIISGVDIVPVLSSHVDNDDIHITTEERADWNAKATTEYVDTKVANLVDSSPATLDTLNELAAALGDDPNFATTVANQIGLKANQSDLDSHTSNTTAHITATERTNWNNKADQSDLDSHTDNKSNPHNVTKSQVGLGNVDNTSDANKPVSTAQREALDSLKSELSETIVSEAKEWTIADEDGNVVAKVDSNGLETTTVTAKAMVVNGTDVKTTLDNISSDISDITNGDVVVAEATHAESANKDANGNVIVDTYETKADANSKLETAKGYTDTVASSKVNTSDVVDNLTTSDATKVLSANQGVVIQDQIALINSKLADLMYEVIAFTSFTNNVGTVELGTTVNSVKLTWATNKTPTTLTLAGSSIDASLTSYTYNDLNLKPTSVTTKSYTIAATDERGGSATKTTSFSFVNGVYYGAIDESATIDSATVLAMSRKLQNSRGMTVTITPGSTEYIAFAFPSRLGTPTFKMGGFETTCNCTPIQFTNASGYTETYNVYTTTNTGLGKTEVVVS